MSTKHETDLWVYSGTGWGSSTDITGYKVEAIDGSIGKIDEATYETDASYVVVDTGPWIFGKKVVLPAGVIDRIDPRRRDGLRQSHEGRDQERAGVRRQPLRHGGTATSSGRTTDRAAGVTGIALSGRAGGGGRTAGTGADGRGAGGPRRPARPSPRGEPHRTGGPPP